MKDYFRARGKQLQRDNLSPHNDSSAAKLTLEIEQKELLIMKRELALISRRHSVREHSSDEEEDGVEEKWVANAKDYQSQLADEGEEEGSE